MRWKVFGVAVRGWLYTTLQYLHDVSSWHSPYTLKHRIIYYSIFLIPLYHISTHKSKSMDITETLVKIPVPSSHSTLIGWKQKPDVFRYYGAYVCVWLEGRGKKCLNEQEYPKWRKWRKHQVHHPTFIILILDSSPQQIQHETSSSSSSPTRKEKKRIKTRNNQLINSRNQTSKRHPSLQKSHIESSSEKKRRWISRTLCMRVCGAVRCGAVW